VNKNNDFFNKLYLDLYGSLIKYAYRLTFDKSLAEDIVQETLIEAYKRIELLQQHENPVGWLHVSTRNIAKAKLRNKRKIQSEIHIAKNLIKPGGGGDKISYYISDYLTKAEADIIIRFYEHNQPISEIAKAYGISLSACKMRLKRTREKIKKEYKNIFFDM
jgi:RNA polymerase sigma-70 factor (ECF subfamily)